jgi:hypothetical protein
MYSVLATFRSTLTVKQQRIVRLLGLLSMIVLAGVTITGVWQFFAHESNAAWFDDVPGSGARQQARDSTGAGLAVLSLGVPPGHRRLKSLTIPGRRKFGRIELSASSSTAGGAGTTGLGSQGRDLQS